MPKNRADMPTNQIESRPIPAILVGLIIASLIALISIIYLTRDKGLQPTERPANANEAVNKRTRSFYQDDIKLPPQPPEDEVVYSYAGVIQEIDSTNGAITILTDRGTKVVSVGAGTEILQKTVPSPEERSRLSTAELTEKLSQETTFSGTLAVGDRISAFSDTNVQGASNFTAQKIVVFK